MKIRDKKLLICLAAIAVLTIAAITLKTVACFTELDHASGHFDGKGLITTARVLIALGAAIAVAYVFIKRETESLIADFHAPVILTSSGVSALAFVFLGIDAVASLSGASSPQERVLSYAVAVFSVGGALYLLSHLFFGKRYSAARGFIGICPILCLALYAILLYFDRVLPINAPCKIADQMAFALASLFFTADVRLTLGREKWRLYVPMGFLAFIAASYSAVPSLIVYFVSAIKDSEPVTLSLSISGNVLCLTLAIFAVAKVYTVAFLKTDKQGRVAEMIFDRSTKPEVTEEEPLEYNDENQISIDDLIANDYSDTTEEGESEE